MNRFRLLLPILLFCAAVGLGQAPVPVKVKVRAALFDRDLNLKPVPRLAMTLHNLGKPGQPAITVQTNLDGVAEFDVPSGAYRLTTDKPVELVGKAYLWDMEVKLTKPENLLELSNDNARTSDLTGGRGARVDELAEQFKRVRDSIVVVWAEDMAGDGVLVDRAGLVLTSYALVEGHDWLAVQFDATHKVTAQVLAFDKLKDVAVLRVNLEAITDPVIAQVAGDPAALIEGERIFTVRNSLEEGRSLMTGVISKTTSEKLVCDVKLPDLGGPVFSSTGGVVGFARWVEKERQLAPVALALPTLVAAREKVNTTPPPSAKLLPCVPLDRYPVEPLKARGATKWEKEVYASKLGDFEVEFITPVSQFEEDQERYLAAMKEREKQAKKGKELPSVAEPDYKYRPVLLVSVVPGTKMNFWESMARANTKLPASYRFKSSFTRMRLLCGGKEIEPLWPRRATTGNYGNAYAVVEDSTYRGDYFYAYDSISPECGQVTLEITSAKDPAPLVKVIDAKLVGRFWEDFEAYRKVHTNTSAQR